MIEVQFSKKLWAMLNDKEREEAEKIANEFLPNYEGKTFFPWPPGPKERADKEFMNKNVEITFFHLSGKPKHFLIMLMPLFIKNQGKNVLYMRWKDEDAPIHLDFQYKVEEGHHRLSKDSSGE